MSALAKPAIWQNNYSFVDAPEKLSAIRESHINLAIWKRSADPTMLPIIHWLAKEPFEVALMKGKLWPKNDMGIYHRSPKPEADKPRLVVNIDVAP